MILGFNRKLPRLFHFIYGGDFHPNDTRRGTLAASRTRVTSVQLHGTPLNTNTKNAKRGSCDSGTSPAAIPINNRRAHMGIQPPRRQVTLPEGAITTSMFDEKLMVVQEEMIPLKDLTPTNEDEEKHEDNNNVKEVVDSKVDTV